jgi:YD repeat-containing protein
LAGVSRTASYDLEGLTNLNRAIQTLLIRLAIGCLALGLDTVLYAQNATTFEFFYRDDGQLIKVIDSSGNMVTYNYDQVGNFTSITRGAGPATGTSAITNFTPQRAGPGTAVTIQGQGFSATPSSDTVQFNGTTATVISATTTLVATVTLGASAVEWIASSFEWDSEAGHYE